MTTQSITELEERLAAILTDGITVGAQVYSAPGSFFDADVKPYIVTAVTDPTIRPGLFPGEPSVLGGGTVTAHPVGDPTTVVTVARTSFVVLPPMHLPTFIVRRTVGRKVEVLGWDEQGAGCPEWMTDEALAICSINRTCAKALGDRWAKGAEFTVERNA